ncbi:MAG TPA: hypothetical protein VKG26_15670, partial [Bacteroidia bacterium]|nr:hypothetical protein [Bacteroidia bacterium]
MKSAATFFLCLFIVFAKGQNRDIAGNLIVERHKLTPIYGLCYKAPEPLSVLYEYEVATANRQWNYIDLADQLNKKLLNTQSIKDTIYPLIEILEFGIITQKIACFKNDQFGSSKNKIYSVDEFKKLITSVDTILEGAFDEKTNRDT